MYAFDDRIDCVQNPVSQSTLPWDCFCIDETHEVDRCEGASMLSVARFISTSSAPNPGSGPRAGRTWMVGLGSGACASVYISHVGSVKHCKAAEYLSQPSHASLDVRCLDMVFEILEKSYNSLHSSNMSQIGLADSQWASGGRKGIMKFPRRL